MLVTRAALDSLEKEAQWSDMTADLLERARSSTIISQKLAETCPSPLTLLEYPVPAAPLVPPDDDDTNSDDGSCLTISAAVPDILVILRLAGIKVTLISTHTADQIVHDIKTGLDEIFEARSEAQKERMEQELQTGSGAAEHAKLADETLPTVVAAMGKDRVVMEMGTGSMLQ